MNADFSRALIIRKPYIDRILAGEKLWELRSRPTNIIPYKHPQGAVVWVKL